MLHKLSLLAIITTLSFALVNVQSAKVEAQVTTPYPVFDPFINGALSWGMNNPTAGAKIGSFFDGVDNYFNQSIPSNSPFSSQSGSSSFGLPSTNTQNYWNNNCGPKGCLYR